MKTQKRFMSVAKMKIMKLAGFILCWSVFSGDLLAEIPLPEYPRPDFQRDTWLNLNGQWDFAFDKEDIGLKEKWYQGRDNWPNKILVPYVHQSKLSGIEDIEDYKQVWYHRTFVIPSEMLDRNIRLHIGAADFHATVWVNGQEVGSYEGGYTPFFFNITNWIEPAAENDLTIRVFDDHEDPAQPRGKQRPAGRNRWHYTHLTGIWQTVWLEAVGDKTISNYKVTTDIHPPSAAFEIAADGTSGGEWIQLEIINAFDKKVIASGKAEIKDNLAKLTLEVLAARLWDVDNPNLYDIQITLAEENKAIDTVKSYIGFRTVAARNGKFWLNDKPVWLSGPLDQGYYPEGLYTPPCDDAFVEDIQWVKRFGYNHIRKHQMVPAPRFLYHCDRMGVLVWGEMANAAEGHFSQLAVDIALREWERTIERDRNHPCIVTWVYSNENWMHSAKHGQEEIDSYRKAFEQMKAWDATRPIVDTSGYYHVISDIMDTHYYPKQKRLEMLYQCIIPTNYTPANLAVR